MSKDSLADEVFLKVWNKPYPFFFIGERFRWAPPGRFNRWRVGPDDKSDLAPLPQTQRGSAATTLGEVFSPVHGIMEASQTQSTSSDGGQGMVDITLSVKLDALQYSDAFAQVRISTDLEADPLLVHCDLIVNESHLT